MHFSPAVREIRPDQPWPDPAARAYRRALHVEIGDAEGVGLDEVPPGLDEIAHQGREGLLGRIGMADLDLQQGSNLGVECGFPQLLRVHLAQTLVTLYVDAAPAQLHDRFDEAYGPGDRVGLVACGKGAGALVVLGELPAVRVEPPRLARTQQCRVDQVPLADPLSGATQDQPLAGDDLTLPQALVLGRQEIKPLGGAAGGGYRP